MPRDRTIDQRGKTKEKKNSRKIIIPEGNTSDKTDEPQASSTVIACPQS